VTVMEAQTILGELICPMRRGERPAGRSAAALSNGYDNPGGRIERPHGTG